MMTMGRFTALLGSLLVWTGAATADPFKTTQLSVGIERIDKMTMADFDGDGHQDIVLLGRTEDRQKRLQYIPLVNGKVKPGKADVVALDPGVLLFDTGKMATDKDKSLLFVLPGKVARYDLKSKKLTTLIEADSIFRRALIRTTALNRWEILHDVNGDGLADIVLPDFDHTAIFVQQSDGTFAPPQKIELPAHMRIFRDQSAVFAGLKPKLSDHNFDGETDLVYRVKSRVVGI